MQETNTGTAKAAVSLTKRELLSHYTDIVDAVIKQYVEIMALHPLVANKIDRDDKPSRKLSFDLVNYKVDIERATEYALSDRIDLQATWFSLALGEPTKPALRDEVIWKCGRAYNARSLQPWRYWGRTR